MKLRSIVATTLSTYAAIAAVSLSSQAQTFSGTSTNVRWGQASAGSNTNPVFSGVGTDTFRWGDADKFGIGENKLTFKTIAFDKVDLNSLFAIGELSYFNGTVLVDTSVEKVPLFFDFSFNEPLSLIEPFQLDLDLINTPNLSNVPEENADSVLFPNNYPLRKFTVNNKDYQITLAGFSQDGGANKLSKLSALEGGNSITKLYAKIIELPVAATPPPPPNSHTGNNNGNPPKQRVPEPGMLFGISLVVVYGVSRRRLWAKQK